MTKPYDDMIHLPHPTSPSRPRMSAHDRAAQFSPFAALTGYDTALTETARLTDTRVELDESGKAVLNDQLRMIQEHIDQHPKVSVTYFLPDPMKAGGAYITTTGCVKKIDEYYHIVLMQDAAKIPIQDILEIDGEILSAYDSDHSV